MHGSKELACTVRHVLKDYFIFLWNTSTKENKQILKNKNEKKGNQTPTNEQQYAESCLWLCYPTRSHLFWMLMQMHHTSKKILKIHLLLDRNMYHTKLKDLLLYNPNINFSTYVKNFSKKFSLKKIIQFFKDNWNANTKKPHQTHISRSHAQHSVILYHCISKNESHQELHS